MKILISGASGLIGSALAPSLCADGHEVIRLVRAAPRPGAAEIHWDPATDSLDPSTLEGLDAVVHLAGENVAEGRWTRRKRARIRDSRVRGTSLLARMLAALAAPPKVLASASAVGYYGSRGDELLDEESPPGDGFLSGVCRDWEAATDPAAAAGVRVVHLRTGMVLSTAGGALAKMLPLFRCGLGGCLADGRQYVSWITLDDVAGAIRHVLLTDSLDGPVNLVAPEPVTNRELTRTLGRILRRPTLLPVPAFVLRAALGQMADGLLLSSTRVLPRRLLESGHAFGDPKCDPAVERLLA